MSSSYVGREACCCGAWFQIEAYTSESVNKYVSQFRDTHAPCRQAWAVRMRSVEAAPRPGPWPDSRPSVVKD